MYLETSKVEVTCTFNDVLCKDFTSMASELLNIPRCKIIDCSDHRKFLIFIYGSLLDALEFTPEDRVAASKIIERYSI